jgi:hypothetical protein
MGILKKSNTKILKRKKLTYVWAFQFSKCPLGAYIRCCPFIATKGNILYLIGNVSLGMN